jgi:hypothetical protein
LPLGGHGFTASANRSGRSELAEDWEWHDAFEDKLYANILTALNAL